MKTGFALIEVMIAAVIASLLSAALFFSWNQVQRVAVSADNTMSIFDRAILIQGQLERDFMGMCVPISRPYLKSEEKEQEKDRAAKPEEKTEQKKEKPKLVERVFYAKNQAGDLLETLTFLTNNPLAVYWSDRAGAARPRIARVQYTLKKEDLKKEKIASYALYRQEAYTLDSDKFAPDNEKSVRSYEIINGIKELKLSYWQEVQTEKEIKDGEKAKIEIDKEIKKVVEWDLDKEPVSQKTFIRPIPVMIKVELSIWDMQKKKSRSFTFMIPVPIDIENPQEVKKKQEQSAPPVKSVLPNLPIPERLKQKTTSPAATQVQTDIVVINVDQQTALKNLLNEKEVSGKPA